jgi:hypothetical protein
METGMGMEPHRPMLVSVTSTTNNQGGSEQVMTHRFESIIIDLNLLNFAVVKLRNRTTITWVPRLDLDNFDSQLDSPGLVQKFPKMI